MKISPSWFKAASAGVVAVALLAGCSEGPGDEQDLADALARDDVFTATEAECIAAKVFETYGADEDAIRAISDADDIEELSSVSDFTENFASFQTDCTS